MTKEEKCSATQKGRIVVHKGDKEKRIYPDQLEEFESNGWVKGKSKSHIKNGSKAVKESGKLLGNQNGFKKGQHPWNYGEKAEDHPKLQAALDKAHKASIEKGPWNKGLTKETDNRVKSLSDIERTSEWKSNMSNSLKNSEKLKSHFENETDQEKKIRVTKAWLTKKKNGTTGTSKPEEMLYEQLLKDNETKTIYRNYKDERYPYHCDFYIVEDDLFIELNAHWTHGGKPYDPNDYSCKKQLEIWEEKAKTSKYYQEAIKTWTVRDVEKAKCAKENNLNYWVIY